MFVCVRACVCVRVCVCVYVYICLKYKRKLTSRYQRTGMDLHSVSI